MHAKRVHFWRATWSLVTKWKNTFYPSILYRITSYRQTSSKPFGLQLSARHSGLSAWVKRLAFLYYLLPLVRHSCVTKGWNGNDCEYVFIGSKYKAALWHRRKEKKGHRLEQVMIKLETSKLGHENGRLVGTSTRTESYLRCDDDWLARTPF